jgi:hypothetical protein
LSLDFLVFRNHQRQSADRNCCTCGPHVVIFDTNLTCMVLSAWAAHMQDLMMCDVFVEALWYVVLYTCAHWGWGQDYWYIWWLWFPFGDCYPSFGCKLFFFCECFLLWGLLSFFSKWSMIVYGDSHQPEKV